MPWASSSPCSVSTTADTCDMSASGFSSPLTGRAPTMADVAKRAAVSSQTVSRVVRGQTNVSEVTRLKVELAIDELGYRRTGIARALGQDP